MTQVVEILPRLRQELTYPKNIERHTAHSIVSWPNPILHSQYHGCWCPGDARSQCISNHDIDYVEQKLFGPHTSRVEIFFVFVFPQQCVGEMTAENCMDFQCITWERLFVPTENQVISIYGSFMCGIPHLCLYRDPLWTALIYLWISLGPVVAIMCQTCAMINSTIISTYKAYAKTPYITKMHVISFLFRLFQNETN